MPRYPDNLISEICAANDIIDYVSEYVSLKRSGRDYSGLCPFHNEKSPSFHVSRQKQLYHCFGCGASGNIIQFVMRTENLDFTDALKLLADKAGIALPEDDSGYDDENHKKRIRILEMNKLAARFFYNSLTGMPEGQGALKYLFDRKITPKTINTYGLGYALPGYTHLLDFLKEKGYSEQEIIDASLAVKRESRIYDKFRDRVMFPIINTRGDIIGFGGRITDTVARDGFKPPKYLNSGETLVFNKGRNLFSLNLAKNSNESSIILCEGYMDVISVYQAGIKNIVATLGTAVTAEQAKLLARYAKTILLCYDSDEAGQKATIRATDIINSVNGSARVIRLRGAKDPDEFIKNSGVALFKKAMAEAVPANQFKLSSIKLKYDLTDTDNKVKYITEAIESLLELRSAVEVDAYINKISAESNISKDAVYAEYRKLLKNESKRNREKKNVTVKAPAYAERGSSQHTPISTRHNKITEAEKRILSIIVRDKKLSGYVKERLSPEDFSSSVYSKLAEMIYNLWDSGKTPEESVLVNAFSNDVDMQNEAASVFYNNEIYSENSEAIHELLNSVIMGKITAELAVCSDPVRIRELIEKKSKLADMSENDD